MQLKNTLGSVALVASLAFGGGEAGAQPSRKPAPRATLECHNVKDARARFELELGKLVINQSFVSKTYVATIRFFNEQERLGEGSLRVEVRPITTRTKAGTEYLLAAPTGALVLSDVTYTSNVKSPKDFTGTYAALGVTAELACSHVK